MVLEFTFLAYGLLQTTDCHKSLEDLGSEGITQSFAIPRSNTAIGGRVFALQLGSGVNTTAYPGVLELNSFLGLRQHHIVRNLRVGDSLERILPAPEAYDIVWIIGHGNNGLAMWGDDHGVLNSDFFDSSVVKRSIRGKIVLLCACETALSLHRGTEWNEKALLVSAVRSGARTAIGYTTKIFQRMSEIMIRKMMSPGADIPLDPRSPDLEVRELFEIPSGFMGIDVDQPVIILNSRQ